MVLDSTGCDLSAVISSLVQLFLDPQVRTIRGFHCLVQKEWVALGHPFTKRLGHTRNQVEEQVSALRELVSGVVYLSVVLAPYFLCEHLLRGDHGRRVPIYTSLL